MTQSSQILLHWQWHLPLGLLLAASSQVLLAASDAIVDGPAQVYLSKYEFPGMHIMERVDSGTAFRIYPRGVLPKGDKAPLQVDSAEWETMGQAREALEKLLHIPEPEPLETPWALFDSQGRRIKTLDQLGNSQVAFLIEIGQWMWPAVRIGFEQHAQGVNGGAPATLRTLSVRPQVFEVRDFLTTNETVKVMKIGKKQGLVNSQGQLQSSDVAKGTAHAAFRTSRQAWLSNFMSPLVEKLDRRISNLTRIPTSHNEPVQILRYDETQYYHGHMDWTELELYNDQREIWTSSHFGHQDRLATVFWYLNDVAEGGETLFPKFGQPICSPESRLGGSNTRHCKGAPDPDMQSCRIGLKVPPKRGTVILWYNFHPSGRGDRNALHAGCPVGPNLTKWSANKWVRIKPFNAREKWIDNHPALERFGWQQKDENSCQIKFINNSGETVKVVWMHPETKKGHVLTTIKSGASLSQSSFIGHRFILKSNTQKSNVVKCPVSRAVTYELNSAFSLEKTVKQEL